MKKFQVGRELNYLVIEEVEVQESLEGVELHPDADEKAQTQEELFSALRFRDLRYKLDRYPYLD